MTRQCIAKSRRDEQCQREGVAYLGSGRFVCNQHHIHGFIPGDLAEDSMVAEAQRERMARVLYA